MAWPAIVRSFVVGMADDYRPSYRLGPFDNAVLRESHPGSDGAKWHAHLQDKHHRRFDVCVTSRGRQAIALALRTLGIESTDTVTILTTTGNTYISKCVTDEIERVCSWSRKICPTTAAVLVNHEFGFAFESMECLKALHVPIIDDRAFSYATACPDEAADFIVYSLPKFFPVQFGGLLYYDRDKYAPVCERNAPCEAFLGEHLAAEVGRIGEYSRLRRENHMELSALFDKIGMATRFSLDSGTVPGAFMFRVPPHWDLRDLRSYCWANGVESSAFFGEQTYYLPVHHRLKKEDLAFFAALIESYQTTHGSA